MPLDIKSGQTGPTRAAEIRSRLKHPVIDADAHAIEFGPAYLDFLKQVAGPKVTDRFLSMVENGGWYGLTPQQRLEQRVARPSAWTMPAPASFVALPPIPTMKVRNPASSACLIASPKP